MSEPPRGPISISIDVNGNDNQPEWGWCRWPDGCKEPVYPIWTSGADDPDLLYCEAHIGAEIARLRAALQEIRRDLGHVCKDFDTCQHVACSDSFAAWHIANEALGGSEQWMTDEQEIPQLVVRSAGCRKPAASGAYHELRDALFEYGEHLAWCDAGNGASPCVCGLDKIRNGRGEP